MVILAGDFNKMPDNLITSHGLQLLFDGPTHQCHNLDKIFASEQIYEDITCMDSTINTKHKAIVARSKPIETATTGKIKTTHQSRTKSPAQHAAFLEFLQAKSWTNITDSNDAETAFDSFYVQIKEMLNTFYPLRNVTVSNHDPDFVTPEIKIMLKRKNNLMKRGLVEAADRITARIRLLITKQNTLTFSSTARGSKELWSKVREVTGKKQI